MYCISFCFIKFPPLRLIIFDICIKHSAIFLLLEVIFVVFIKLFNIVFVEINSKFYKSSIIFLIVSFSLLPDFSKIIGNNI